MQQTSGKAMQIGITALNEQKTTMKKNELLLLNTALASLSMSSMMSPSEPALNSSIRGLQPGRKPMLLP